MDDTSEGDTYYGADPAQQQSGSGWTSEKPTSGDYVTVSDYSKSAGGFHHTGIAVDSDDTQGFSTKDPKTPWWERIFGAPKARMEDDLQMHTSPDGEVAPHSYLYHSITSDQAGAIQGAIDARSQPDGAGRYNLIFRNCAGAVESFIDRSADHILVPAILIISYLFMVRSLSALNTIMRSLTFGHSTALTLARKVQDIRGKLIAKGIAPDDPSIAL
jgi:hypothetical protein